MIESFPSRTRLARYSLVNCRAGRRRLQSSQWTNASPHRRPNPLALWQARPLTPISASIRETHIVKTTPQMRLPNPIPLRNPKKQANLQSRD